jgi:transcriptional regulator with XRE-family HTH domain
MTIEERFSKRLRALRKRKGYTQEQLAERADLEYKFIQKLEGKRPPSPSIRTLEKLARAFGMPTWKLIQFTPQRKR